MSVPGYVKLLEGTRLPRLAPIRQSFAAKEAGDPKAAVQKAMQETGCAARVRPGMSVALTVGSRGMAALDALVPAIVAELKAAGAEPFIVPSMGSHGGATAEGQLKVLAKLGITEASAGCPIRSSMETVQIGELDNGMPVRMDKLAQEADGIVLFNRIKPHTSFRFPNESGLIKMLAIGLGKQSGADNCHAWGIDWLGPLIVEMARVKLQRSPILFGIGTIENAYDRLSEIVVLPPEGMVEAEQPYLQQAMRNLPRLPLGPLDEPLASGPLDVLVVDEIGKEYAGTGMDPNITGRASSNALTGGPDVARIAVLDVSERSGGNANGVARADVITDRLFNAFDREAVYANCLTSNMLNSGALPVSMPDDRSAIMAAVKTCGARDPSAITMLRIPNSLHLEYLLASETLLDDLAKRPGIDILSEPEEMVFDAAGNLDRQVWSALHG
ncbi:lactate racemase domain-containing protein [Pseudooceanicola sp. C21-150M6]|uniref:lactate racemase domain-containing protein n=1 Tax=Pseudooceanicola sp. C21-150M6 TaxID=3434355 RepID=UPI003D7FD705